MKQISITPPAKLNAHITLPSSKSICNRALIINALAGGDISLLSNLSDCDDTRVTLRALQSMPAIVDIMAAGTAMRFLTAYLAATDCGSHIITGTERMKQRPIGILVNALRQLGAEIEYTENEGFPPLKIKGKILKGDSIELPGGVSSQYISALLMTGPMFMNGLKLTLTGDIVSRPYIDMTLDLMREYGSKAEWTASNCLEVSPQAYKPRPYSVESDWSAASYWYEMVALSEDGRVELPRLKEKSTQGDAAIKDIFDKLGVKTSFEGDTAVLNKGIRTVDTLECDFTGQPDMAQTFVVTCAMMGVTFRLSGLQSLKIKETDRMAALITEMRKLGFVIKEHDGSVLAWDGERCQPMPDAAIDTYEDHRMAMAFAPAAIKLGDLKIKNPQVVSKSYPAFWDDLRMAGFGLATFD